jgi:tight adherence protein C
MSELWFLIAIGCVFFSVVLVGFAIDATATEKKRAVRLLETQVRGSSSLAESTDLREREMARNFGERVLVPFVGGASRVAKRITPLDARDRVAKKLLLAGSPPGWDAERVIAFKVIGAGVGFVGGGIVGIGALHLRGLPMLVVVALLGIVGFLLPDSMIARRVADRQKEVLSTLSDTLDLLTISVEAGLSLNAAIAQVVQNVPGVLSSEFARMLQEIQLGVPRSDAFRQLAERTDVDELNSFALAMIQADVFGVSIASVLRTQASQLRIKRRQAAEAKAQQTPVKIVFPLILCILPALFVVIIGPGAIRIMNNLFIK